MLCFAFYGNNSVLIKEGWVLHTTSSETITVDGINLFLAFASVS